MHKKLMVLMLVATMVFMVGCKSSDKDDSKEEEIINPAQALNIDFSKGLDDQGYYKDVKAMDYVDLMAYDKVLVDKAKHDITDQVLEAEVAKVMASYSSLVDVTDRKVMDGDTLNIDYVGSVDGVEFEGGSTDGQGAQVILGQTNFIDGFLEQLVGHELNETFNIDVTFPTPYQNTDLQGKDAVFEITINTISESVLPELTDAFIVEHFKASHGVETVDAFKETLASDLKEKGIREFVQEYLMTQAVVTSVPEPVMDFQIMSMENNYKTTAFSYNVSVEEYLKQAFGYDSLEAIVEASAIQLQGTCEISLIIQAIAEDAGVTVNEEDMKAYFEKNFDSEDFAPFAEVYGEGFLKNVILQDKILDMIIADVELEQ